MQLGEAPGHVNTPRIRAAPHQRVIEASRTRIAADRSWSCKVAGVQLAVGADDVFGVHPARRPVGLPPASIGGACPATCQFLPDASFSPSGFDGRFLYARVAAGL